MPQSVYCPDCGKPTGVWANRNFCFSCGKAVTPVESPKLALLVNGEEAKPE